MGKVTRFVPRQKYRFKKDYVQEVRPLTRIPNDYYAHQAQKGDRVVFEFKSIGYGQFWFLDKRDEEDRSIPIMLTQRDCFKYLEEDD